MASTPTGSGAGTKNDSRPLSLPRNDSDEAPKKLPMFGPGGDSNFRGRGMDACGRGVSDGSKGVRQNSLAVDVRADIEGSNRTRSQRRMESMVPLVCAVGLLACHGNTSTRAVHIGSVGAVAEASHPVANVPPPGTASGAKSAPLGVRLSPHSSREASATKKRAKATDVGQDGHRPPGQLPAVHDALRIPGRFLSVGAGKLNTCAVTASRQVRCWGSNMFGESDAPPLRGVRRVAGSTSRGGSCALHNRGTHCWGDAADGANAECEWQDDGRPLCHPPLSLADLVHTSTDGFVGCGLDAKGAFRCREPPTRDCGLDDNPEGFRRVVGDARELRPVLGVGGDLTCGLTASGQVMCWASDQVFGPVGEGLTGLAVGVQHACALDGRGRAHCYGGWPARSAVPDVAFTQLSLGAAHTCGVTDAQQLWCWGDNSLGQVTPEAGSVMQIATGDRGLCALHTDGTVMCFEAGRYRQPSHGVYREIGDGGCGVRLDGAIECRDGFVKGGDWHGVVRAKRYGFDGYRTHICALDRRNRASCWGDGAVADPKQQPTTAFSKLVTIGRDAICGLTDHGRAICWGDIEDAQPEGRYRALAEHCGLRVDGTVDCWSAADKPAWLTGQFDDIAGGRFTCALRKSSEPVCWLLQEGLPRVELEKGYVPEQLTGEVDALCGLRRGQVSCFSG